MASPDSFSFLLDWSTRLRDPGTYYQGVELPDRWQVQNLIVFLRRSVEALQQRNFANQLHHRFVLLFVLETSGYLHLDGETVPLNPGDGILIHPYQFHHYSGLESAELRWLFLTFELESGQSALECLRHRVVRLEAPGQRRLGDIVREYRPDQGPARPEVLLPLVDCLLGELVQSADAIPGGKPEHCQPGGNWFSSVEPKLRQGLDAGLSLATIASGMGVSERSLRQRFKAEAGITLRDYRINHQLHRAVSLMRRPELSLKRIAELSGFQSAQSFSRFFRQVTGLTARDYRARAQNDASSEISL
jgi:AraC-like DNA-binding protein